MSAPAGDIGCGTPLRPPGARECYVVALWKTYRAEHLRAQKLPAILPIVVHHSPTGWTAPVAFEDMIAADPELLEALGPHVPRFRFRGALLALLRQRFGRRRAGRVVRPRPHGLVAR